MLKLYTALNQTITLIIDQAEQLNALRTRLSIIELKLQEKEKEQSEAAKGELLNYRDHIICMVALPFRDNQTFPYETVLLPAIRRVLELKPYYWQVVRADEQYFEETIERNVGVWMQRAQAYIADISDLNSNVLMELGYMRWGRRGGKEKQPVVVLERIDATSHKISDLAGVIRITYPLPSAEKIGMP